MLYVGRSFFFFFFVEVNLYGLGLEELIVKVCRHAQRLFLKSEKVIFRRWNGISRVRVAKSKSEKSLAIPT